MEEKILKAIENIRPYLNMDGGDVEFIKYEDDYVFVKLTGRCAGCPMQDVTPNNMLYEFIKNEIPNLKGVINVTI